MHFCPQEAVMLLALISGGGTFFTYVGWRLRALFGGDDHVHCEDDETCDKKDV